MKTIVTTSLSKSVADRLGNYARGAAGVSLALLFSAGIASVHGKSLDLPLLPAGEVETQDASESVEAADLLVACWYSHGIFKFDGLTGAYEGEFTDTYWPSGLAFGPDGNLYVSEAGDDVILRYDGQTGAFIDTFATGGGMDSPRELIFGPDGNIYVVSYWNGKVIRFNGLTGAYIDTFVSTGLDNPFCPVFGPDGNLYVASGGNSKIQRYDGITGAFIDTFVDCALLGLTAGPIEVLFGPDGHLYVVVGNNNDRWVVRFDGETGAYMDDFIPQGTGGVDTGNGLVFGPDRNFYVGGFVSDAVHRYDGETGGFIDTFASMNLDGVTSLHFTPSEQSAYDVGATVVNYPTGSLQPGSHMVNATVENFGTVAQEGVPVNCSITLASVPVLEEFAGEFPATGWFLTNSGNGAWTQLDGSIAGGESPEAWLPAFATDGAYPNRAQLVKEPTDTTGTTDLILEFTHAIVPAGTVVEGRSTCILRARQSESHTWATVKQWNVEQGGIVGPILESLDISSHIGDGTQIKFYYHGFGEDLTGWAVDNVKMYGSVPGSPVYNENTTVDVSVFEAASVDFTPAWNAIWPGYKKIAVTTESVDDPVAENNWAAELVEVQERLDVGTVSINYPFTDIEPGAYTVDATVENFGNVDQNDVLVRCTITEGTPHLLEDFSDAFPPADWFLTNNGNGYWEQHMGGLAGGDSPEAWLQGFVSSSSAPDKAQLVKEPMDTSGATDLTLTFKHAIIATASAVDDRSGCILRARQSEAHPWMTVKQWYIENGDVIGPEYETLDISLHIGSATQIKFFYHGYGEDLIAWAVDDVRIHTSNPANLVYTSDVLANIASYGTEAIAFAPQWSALPGIFDVTVTTLLPSDQDFGNDVAKEIVAVWDDPPLVPVLTGPHAGTTRMTYSYTAGTTDPEGHQVYYRFDWGDGNDSGWLGPYPSATDIEVSHSWWDTGLYPVRVKSKDIYDVESDWSAPLQVRILAPPRELRIDE